MYFLLNDNLSLLEIMAISSVNGTQSLVLVRFAKKSLRMIVVMALEFMSLKKCLVFLYIPIAVVLYPLIGWTN